MVKENDVIGIILALYVAVGSILAVWLCCFKTTIRIALEPDSEYMASTDSRYSTIRVPRAGGGISPPRSGSPGKDTRFLKRMSGTNGTKFSQGFAESDVELAPHNEGRDSGIRVPTVSKAVSDLRVPRGSKTGSGLRVPKDTKAGDKDDGGIRVPRDPFRGSGLRVPREAEKDTGIRIPRASPEVVEDTGIRVPR